MGARSTGVPRRHVLTQPGPATGRRGTKTKTVRDVDLVPEAVEALRPTKPFTFLAEKDAPIFCHPRDRQTVD